MFTFSLTSDICYGVDPSLTYNHSSNEQTNEMTNKQKQAHLKRI